MSKPECLKLVVIGDGAVGKTCLLIVYTKRKFPTEYIPTVFENYLQPVTLPGDDIAELLKLNVDSGEQKVPPPDRHYDVELWDTGGGEDYYRLRPLSYPETSVFLICFSVESEDSFENVRSYWLPEITHHKPKTPWLLVGLKTDLRPNPETSPGEEPVVESSKYKSTFISAETAAAEAADLKAACYVECSSLHQIGVDNVFQEAVKAAVKRIHQKRNKNCQLL